MLWLNEKQNLAYASKTLTIRTPTRIYYLFGSQSKHTKTNRFSFSVRSIIKCHLMASYFVALHFNGFTVYKWRCSRIISMQLESYEQLNGYRSFAANVVLGKYLYVMAAFYRIIHRKITQRVYKGWQIKKKIHSNNRYLVESKKK